MKNNSFPLFSAGATPTCFNCERPLNQYLEVESGYALGRGSRRCYCTNCKCWNFYDVEPNTPPENAFVIVFRDETFLGRDQKRVKTVGDAILLPLTEAVATKFALGPGVCTFAPISAFNLDAMRDQIAKESE